MTYATPTPPGQPDFALAQQQPGQLLENATASTSGTVHLGPFYCGNVNSVTFYVAFTASVLRGFTLSTAFGQDMTFADITWSLDNYQGQCQTAVFVTDTLPVLGKFFWLTITATGGSITYDAIVVTSLASTRGAAAVGLGGVCIAQSLTVPHNNTSNAYGNYVTPGLYYYAATVGATVSNTNLTLIYNTAGGLTEASLVAITNPTVSTLYSGLIVIGGYQPVWICANGNTTTTWNPVVTLVGPQV